MPDMSLTVFADRKLTRADDRTTRYALVNFVAPEAKQRTVRIPANVGLVLDRSGSMSGDKIRLARLAVERAIAQLRPDDRFSLVVYDDQVEILQESTPASDDAKRHALGRLARIDARNSTDLFSGWMRGCEQVALHASTERINRVLLLTDGLANHGVTNRDEIVRHAGELFERGVQTSTFGVGADFDEHLLQDQADAAGGHFYFIESATQIPELLAGELGEALEVTVRRASLEVRVPSGVRASVLNRFRSRLEPQSGARRDRALRVELGDLVSAQQISAVLELELPAGTIGDTIGVDVAVVDAEGVPCAAIAALSWTFAGLEENQAQPRDRRVDRQVALLWAAAARAEATECNRHGDYLRARQVLTEAARRVREHGGSDPGLNQIADDLLRDTERYAERPMEMAELKAAHFSAAMAMRERAPTGMAKR
jgi:Ca-activated chloride channel homolog